ncbi:MAG: DUF2157 domain-containing protein [Leptolyngbya sp. Prado105]|jgi:uncharacterized membrane protein|nr:DUF2157 domain-containing protein [Leptolyngbya sp. Prado105]
MRSEQFRQQLRQEAQQWRANGEISETQFQTLRDRYQFDRVNHTNRFTLVLLGLGFSFVGIGVISLITANWSAISHLGRVVILLGLFFGLNGSGLVLRKSPKYEQLGEGLLLCGAVALGANLAQYLSEFTLFFAWGIGVLAIAYGLRLKSIGILAIALIGIGYWTSWNQIYFGSEPIGLQMPIIATILFLPLAYRCRSRTIFLLSAIAIHSALLSSLAAIVTKASVLPSLLIILPAALLWSYDDSLWSPGKSFQPLARQLAVLFLGGLLFWFSFHWVWNGSLTWYTRIPEWRSFPSVVLLAAIAIGQWLYMLRQVKIIHLNTIGVGSIIVFSMIVNFSHLRLQSLAIFAPILFNILLLGLAIKTVQTGLKTEKRRTFWFGTLLLILQILSRLLEYDTPVLIRSLVCVLCGASAIVAGLWFESRIRSSHLIELDRTDYKSRELSKSPRDF